MEDSNGISPEDRVLKVPPTGLRRGNGSWLQGHAQSPFHRLTDDLHARDMPVDEFAADSETPSDEDYDESVKPTLASSKNPVRTHQPRRRQAAAATASSHSQLQLDPGSRTHKSASSTGSNAHIFTDDDKGIQDLLHKTSQLAKDPRAVRKPAKFSGLVFTHRLTAFDPHNAAAANSPFAGFYTLFWLSVALFVFKISAKNWHQYGNPLGSNEIMKTMFSRDGKFSASSEALLTPLLIDNGAKLLSCFYPMASCALSLVSAGSFSFSCFVVTLNGIVLDGLFKM